MPAEPTAVIEDSSLVLKGDWVLPNVVPALPDWSHVRVVEVGQVSRWDSTLAAFLWELQSKAKAAGVELKIGGAPENLRKLLALAFVKKEKVPQAAPVITSKRQRAALWLQKVAAAVKDAVTFLGLIFIHAARFGRTREHFRPQDWLAELNEAGPRALPIVLFLSFLVGLILAFVSAIQLKLFGASIYVADLVGLSMTREMGALMTAIIMAGRTGASYAAQIGSMKRAEELDAMTTMGLSPIDMVVLPKVAALTVMMPVLSIFSVFIGMFAGLIMANSILDISVFQYINETAIAVPLRNLLIGILKAIVYGFLVAYAGAWRGFRCGSSSDAIGRAATSAVVMSLTLIVTADGIFAIVLNALKL